MAFIVSSFRAGGGLPPAAALPVNCNAILKGLKMDSDKAPPCAEHTVRLKHLEKSEDEQWEAINKLRNRPPLWTTAVISLLTFLLGCSVTYAGLLMRVIGR